MALTTATVTELNTHIEDAVTIQRVNGETASFSVYHHQGERQLNLVVLDTEENPRGDLMQFSLAEAKHLRSLLNSAPVVALLDAAE